MDTPSNAIRFLNAYNRLDKGLRDLYNLKPALSFTDVIRKSATSNVVIKKYEDDLVDFGRLRNSIIHRSTEEPIAEPHDNIVERLEAIVRLVTSPPTVMQSIANRNVFVARGDVTLKNLLSEMFKNGYSNIPIYLDQTIVGVVNRKMIIDAIGKAVAENRDINELLNMRIADSLDVLDKSSHYEVVSEDTTIDSILYMFAQDRKLTTIIITKNGTYSEKPVGIIVTADILDMQAIIDNY